MRKLVDLPQPDGPTKTRNSPSAMSRSNVSTAGLAIPGNVRVVLAKLTAAMVRVLSPAESEPGDPVTACASGHRIGHRTYVRLTVTPKAGLIDGPQITIWERSHAVH